MMRQSRADQLKTQQRTETDARQARSRKDCRAETRE